MSNPTDQAEVLRSEKEVLLALLSGPAGDAAAGSLWDAAGDEALLGPRHGLLVRARDQLEVVLADLLEGGRVRPQLALGVRRAPVPGRLQPTGRLEQRRLGVWGSPPEAPIGRGSDSKRLSRSADRAGLRTKRLGVVSGLRRGVHNARA